MVSDLKNHVDKETDGDISKHVNQDPSTIKSEDSRSTFSNRMASMRIPDSWSNACKNFADDTSSFIRTARQVDANNAKKNFRQNARWRRHNDKCDNATVNTSLSSDSSDSGDSSAKENDGPDIVEVPDSSSSDKNRLTVEQKQRKELRELRKKCKRYEKLNSKLSNNVSTLETQLKGEQESNDKRTKEMKGEIDSSLTKLLALEELFKSLNEDNEKDRDLENQEQQKGSIVQLDASYLNELKSSLTEKTESLDQLQEDYDALKLSSWNTKAELQLDIEDMNRKLEARETTIASLEKSIEQMRESLFSPRKARSLQQRQSDSSKDEMNRQLEAKDEIIAKLKEQLEKKTSLLNKDRKEHHERLVAKREKSNLLFNLRKLMSMSEMMTSTTHKLESITEKLNERYLSKNQIHDNTEKEDSNKEDLDNENVSHVLSVVTKVHLFQEEIRTSMKTLELSMKNQLQELDSELKGNISSDKETDQSPGEEPGHVNTEEILERIKRVHDDNRKALRESEADFSKRLNDISSTIQSYELMVFENQENS